ncbi:hypothetical protein ANN_14814 [Periplaneta americana]|uniref:Uncharacterized protein n=1 Tax=Periplaneta americana TaxID=6978 RepID=A0ABQ8SYJ6_PERAM|nr:hypothetical protein ANN_14814 [Periplaneta americana]
MEESCESGNEPSSSLSHKGPVYKYFLGNETYFHECNTDATQGENNSDNDASSVSEENDSDVDEGRSTTTNDTSILSSDRNSEVLNVSDVSNYEIGKEPVSFLNYDGGRKLDQQFTLKSKIVCMEWKHASSLVRVQFKVSKLAAKILQFSGMPMESFAGLPDCRIVSINIKGSIFSVQGFLKLMQDPIWWQQQQATLQVWLGSLRPCSTEHRNQ